MKFAFGREEIIERKGENTGYPRMAQAKNF